MRVYYKILLSFICFVLSLFPLHAEKVDSDKAEKIASHYLQSKLHQRREDAVRLKFAATTRIPAPSTQDTVLYYVFDINDGFIIVSGDDVVTPVLGFSENGRFDEKNMPSNFTGWMDCLQEEIAMPYRRKSLKVKRLNSNGIPSYAGMTFYRGREMPFSMSIEI